MKKLYQKFERIAKRQPNLVNLVPVLAGLKPNATVSIEQSEKDFSELKLLLKSVNLVLVKKTNKYQGKSWVTLFVGKNCQDLKELKEIFHRVGKDRRTGKLLGFPESAIAAFVKDNLLPIEKEPKAMKKFPIQFRLSQKNWKQEFLILKNWNEVIRKNTPRLWKTWQEMLK